MLLVQFEDSELYIGTNLKKTLKAETDFCLALRVSFPSCSLVMF